MAVDLQSTGGYNALLRNVYLDGLNSQLRNELFLFNMIERIMDTETLVGDTIYLDAHTARTSGWQLYGGSDATLQQKQNIPVGTTSKLERMSIPLRYALGSINVAHQAIKRAAGRGFNTQALPWEREMEDLSVEFKHLYQMLYYGDGSGKIAEITGNTGTTTRTATIKEHTRNLQEGMVFDIHASGDVAGSAAKTGGDGVIVATITGAHTFTFACAGNNYTWASGDFITLPDSVGHAVSGLEHIIDASSTSFQGVNRTTNYWAQATVLSNNADSAGTATEYSKKRMKILLIQIKQRYGKPDMILTNHDVASAVAWVEYGARRIDVGRDARRRIETFDSGMDIDGKPLMVDDDATAETIYAWTKRPMVRGQIGGILDEYRDPDGGNFIRPALSSTSQRYETQWEATYEHWGNIAARNCQDMGKLQDVAGMTTGSYADYGGVSA